MSKSAVVRARIEPDLKENAEAILDQLGLNPTQAITIFYRQVEMRGGLPFDVAIPNATTQRVFESTDEGRELVSCDGAEEMFQRLGN